MYNVYNKSDVFYLYDYYENKTYLIGNKKELIKFLSKKTNTNDYNNRVYWSNEYFNNINMGNDNYPIRQYIYVKDIEDNTIEICNETIKPHRYLFFDGFDRVIDVRDFKNDVFDYYENHINDPYRIRFRNRFYRKKRTKNAYKHKMCNNLLYVKKMDSMFKYDDDYKDYNFKNLEDSNNPYPDWWDDTSRRVQANWKSQYKVNKQYNIHNNGKNNKSIRNNINLEYSEEEIDEMLLKDFNKKQDD